MRGVFSTTVTDPLGNILANEPVTIRYAGTQTPAVLYNVAEGGAPISNPTTSDADGVVSFYTAPGRYDVVPDNDGATWTVDVAAPFSSAPSSLFRIQYGSVSSTRIFVPPQIRMGGFRMFGQPYDMTGRLVSTGVVGSGTIANGGANHEVENTIIFPHWYAIFAVANDTDVTCTFTQMPFLRALSVAGSVVTLGSLKETDQDSPEAVTFDWADNALAGTDLLVITEGGLFSGRVTSVVGNTATTITVADVGTIQANSRLLPAPPGWDRYHYGRAHYLETAQGEVRNMADEGDYVGTAGTNILDIPDAGPIPVWTRLNLAGMISPLATGARFSFTYVASTASTGIASHQFGHDSSDHRVWDAYDNKLDDTSQSFSHEVYVPFSNDQETWIKDGYSGGFDGNAITTRDSRLRGYREP